MSLIRQLLRQCRPSANRRLFTTAIDIDTQRSIDHSADHASSIAADSLLKSTLDSDSARRLDSYLDEYRLFKLNDAFMPDRLTEKNLRQLLLIDSKRERIRFLTYVHGVETLRARELTIKAMRRLRLESERIEIRRRIEKAKAEHIHYGFSGSYLFRRYIEGTINTNTNNRLAQSLVHGPRLVIDMSFYPQMRPMEASLTSKQLQVLFHENRAHRFPHHLIFAGCQRQHPSWTELIDRYFKDGFESSLHTVTDRHYTDVFPKDRLIYLSPDAEDELTEYDGEKIYIIAAYVDKIERPKATFARALEEGLESRRLPLDRNFRWMTKNTLCMNHVVNILNDAHTFGDMQAALLQNLPPRKVKTKSGKICQKRKLETDRERMHFLLSLDTNDDSQRSSENMVDQISSESSR